MQFPLFLLLAVLFIVNIANAEVVTKDGVTQIQNVPSLSWERDGATTFAGALDRAANVMDVKTDYAEILGDSSLAFRLRWWRKHEGAGWCPSSPVGEMEPWIDRAAKSLGMKFETFVDFENKAPFEKHVEKIRTWISAGKPILSYGENFDMGVIYGFADDGRKVYLRDYFAGEKPLSLAIEKTKGMMLFPEIIGARPAAIERTKLAIQWAIEDWERKPDEHASTPGPGKYLFGDSAYKVWIDDLKSAGKLPENERKALFQPNWWAYCVLCNARGNAAQYLKRTAPLFEGDVRTALEKASGHYARAHAELVRCFGTQEAFFGPWGGKGLADWSEEIRQHEAEMLSDVQEMDDEAIAELKKALAAIKEAEKL